MKKRINIFDEGLLAKQVFVFLKEDSQYEVAGFTVHGNYLAEKNLFGLAVVPFEKTPFKERKVIKKYLALVVGEIKEGQGKIETLIGRAPKDRRKQKVYLPNEPNAKGKRKAETHFKIIKIFKGYTLLELKPKTGRKHQIRCHLSWFHHPIAGDKLYSFKNQPKPKNLNRQFLHASYLKVKLPSGEEKEFRSKLPKDLEEVIKLLKRNDRQN